MHRTEDVTNHVVPIVPGSAVTLSKTSSTQKETAIGRRERSKAANRKAILDAARLVFAELGYDATTVRDIVRRTDLASGTFYNYFRSKEEIQKALISETLIEFSERLREAKQPDMSFDDYLQCAFGAYFSFLAQKNAEVLKLGAPYLPQSQIMTDTPEMRAIFQEIRKDVEDALEKESGIGTLDTEYLTAAAIGIAREIGDCLLHRLFKTPDGDAVAEATKFATQLTISGFRHNTAS